jgi:hypothetical protein
MNTFSQKGALLFGVMLVVCAFVPSMASAETWSPVGTTHQLFSPNLSFTFTGPVATPFGWRCNGAELDADVASTNTLVVTAARFNDCMGLLAETACTVTPVATGLPWTVTATATDNVQIHNVNVNVAFENTPGTPNGACAFPTTSNMTGTLTGGSWDTTSNELFFQHDDGLTLHFGVLGSTPVYLSAIFRDTTNSLRMFMV